MKYRLRSSLAAFLSILLLTGTMIGCKPDQPTKQAGSPKDWTSHTQGLPFVVGYESGLKEAREKQKPAMFFVTTTWCGWCKKLARDSFQDDEIKKLLTDKFVCVIVDGDTEKAAASSLGAKGFPHVVFQTADGKRVNNCRGYVPRDEFLQIVQEALAKAAPAT